MTDLSAEPDLAEADGGGASPSLYRALSATVAIAAAVGVWATWRVFVSSATGQRLDQSAFDGAEYGRTELLQLASPVLDIVSMTFVVLGLGAAVVIALVRKRWGLIAQVAALVGGSNLTSQYLKHRYFERPDLGVDHHANSLPSGHTTVAASVSIALFMAVPRRVRPVVALFGCAYTAITGLSTLVGRWHRPSDVIAALAVVLAWAALIYVFTPDSALDSGFGGRPASVSSAVVSVLLWGGGLVTGTVAVMALRGTHQAISRGLEPSAVNAYLGGACGVIAATCVAFLLALLLRQATARPL